MTADELSKRADESERWDLEIHARRKLLDINFSEIWHYRDLIILFIRRDFVAQYTQTVLGPLWHLIQPVLTTIMFLLVFGKIAKIPTDGIDPLLFYMAGITIWNYFSFCLTNTSNTFVMNAAIFGKVYFPRIIMPISVTLSNLIRFAIQFGLLLAMMVWVGFREGGITVTWNFLFIPLLLVLMAGTALGLGIIISSLTTKYRDLQVLLTFAVQLFMYATPVAYPMSFLQQSKYGSIIALNPLAPIVEAFRYCLFGAGTFTQGDLLYSLGFMMAAITCGLVLFSRVEKNFIDTV
jgi:lipopolysaccharide transport system permease protein